MPSANRLVDFLGKTAGSYVFLQVLLSFISLLKTLALQGSGKCGILLLVRIPCLVGCLGGVFCVWVQRQTLWKSVVKQSADCRL